MRNAVATIALAVLLGLAGGAARAQEKDSCDQFKWSVARERAAFAGDLKRAASGATVAVGQAYAIALGPGEAVAFAAPPERAPKAGSFGAALGLAEIDKPGLYQITLSDEAWLDVVQSGATIKSTGFSGQKNCPGLRKSVRFDLKPGPATIQISNASAATIDLAIEPAP
jgi:hypothetical protein